MAVRVAVIGNEWFMAGRFAADKDFEGGIFERILQQGELDGVGISKKANVNNLPTDDRITSGSVPPLKHSSSS